MGMIGNVNQVQLEELECPASEFEKLLETMRTEISIVMQVPRDFIFGFEKKIQKNGE